MAALFSLVCLCAGAQTPAVPDDLDVTLELGGLRAAGPPRILNGELLLTYRFPGEPFADAVPDAESDQQTQRPRRIHTVQAAFDYENFSTLHSFVRNGNEVYLLHIPLPEGIEVVEYRLIVDGIWGTDPSNPETTRDRWGVSLSRFDIPEDPFLRQRFPRIMGNGMVEFRVRALAASSVSVTGSFNGWDPFMTPMEEIAPGVFSRLLRLPPGEHLYYFAVNGARVPDPENGIRRWHRNGQQVSVLQLP